ncbi:hypothetical protein PR202_ga05955 [Eleusine coracana subsp. coracana]|uniref:Uncharacterized protein n=1 Tax=Eleusine coracana subsp. coracana TaxID=191504 RepID=A0AAV5BW05_ELECO|nr:hypothetical protein PR202_ga05955 [Eleusine coracana subsp. coracana]
MAPPPVSHHHDVESGQHHDDDEQQRRPLLANKRSIDDFNNDGGMSPIQRAISQTYQSTAHLATLLPTGTVLAFQLPFPDRDGAGPLHPGQPGHGRRAALPLRALLLRAQLHRQLPGRQGRRAVRVRHVPGDLGHRRRRGAGPAAWPPPALQGPVHRPGARRGLRDDLRRRRALRPERRVVLLHGAVRGRQAGAHRAAHRHRRRREHALRHASPPRDTASASRSPHANLLISY